MSLPNDKLFMQRCLNLAENGLGKTYPNPLVGSVIVHENKIIGEGWHHQAGSPHAEINAIKSVKDKSLLQNSTLYVNLEPCSHEGKTPPCVNAIKKYKIPKVVISSIDPNPKVAGNGIRILKDSGCEVKQSVLEEKSKFINRRFFTYHQKKRPFVILKWAQTIDNYISPKHNEKSENKIFWISSDKSIQKTHKWRSEESAILVGVQTVINDNPNLTTRKWVGNNPTRLILDPNNRIPKNSNLYSDRQKTILFNKKTIRSENPLKNHVLLQPFNLKSFFNYCYEKEIQSIIVEGGRKTLQNFIDEGYWDEARVFTTNKKLIQGIPSPKFECEKIKSVYILDDKLDYYFN